MKVLKRPASSMGSQACTSHGRKRMVRLGRQQQARQRRWMGGNCAHGFDPVPDSHDAPAARCAAKNDSHSESFGALRLTVTDLASSGLPGAVSGGRCTVGLSTQLSGRASRIVSFELAARCSAWGSCAAHVRRAWCWTWSRRHLSRHCRILESPLATIKAVRTSFESRRAASLGKSPGATLPSPLSTCVAAISPTATLGDGVGPHHQRAVSRLSPYVRLTPGSARSPRARAAPARPRGRC